MTFTVVRATPPGGEGVELWFDPRSHLLDRTVEALDTSTRTVRYADYRPVEGAQVPFRITTDEGPGSNVETIHVEHVTWSKPDPRDFRRPVGAADFSITGGQSTVPMEYDGFIVVEARLNGQGPYAFILDTGGRAEVTPEVAQRLGLQLTGAGSAGGAGTGTLRFQFAKLDRLDIGGVSLRDQAVAVVPLGYDTIERGGRAPFAGILGLELFERFAVTLDYRGHTATFRPSKTFRRPAGAFRLPVTFDDDMPLVPGRIDGRDGLIAIDTGLPEPLVVQPVWAERNGLNTRLRAGLPLIASGASGGSFALFANRANLTFGPTALQQIVTYYAEGAGGSLASRSQAGMLGNDVLANFRVTFDYQRGEVWFEPQPGYAPKAYDRAGLSVAKDSAETFVVEFAVDGSPAAEAGIKAGDEILAVDGAPANALSGWDFGRAVRRPPGTRMVLSLRREGQVRSVEVVLRELLPVSRPG